MKNNLKTETKVYSASRTGILKVSLLFSENLSLTIVKRFWWSQIRIVYGLVNSDKWRSEI